ncbi:MAG: hypothetical protein KF823_01510 [Xanthomonadales bacterium]|nr:hypothetical protein [Xanthomonadales bacterium]
MNSFDPRFDPPAQDANERRLAPSPRPSGYRDSLRPRRSPGSGYGRSSGWAKRHRYAEHGGDDLLRLG